MKKRCFCFGVSFVPLTPCVSLSTPDTSPGHPKLTDPLGSSVISRVLSIDTACTLFCDIDAFPPLIGKNIPVRLEGIEIPPAGPINQDVPVFLRQLLMPDASHKAPSIKLNNIRRGTTFCLVADIEVEGKDLAQMLVEKGFARRIIRISSEQAEQQTSVNKSSSEEKSETTTSSVYVAAKTSKVFHRPTCPHAKRLDPAKTLTFQTREEAERNGRRPCKTCNP